MGLVDHPTDQHAFSLACGYEPARPAGVVVSSITVEVTMPEFVQLPLPGMPIRFIVSAVWEDPARPCTIRATKDVPSDQFDSQITGFDTEGLMTLDELQGAMETLLSALFNGPEPLLKSAVNRRGSHLRPRS